MLGKVDKIGGGRYQGNLGAGCKWRTFIFPAFLFLGAILLADENEAGFEKLVSFLISKLSVRHRELCKIIISQRIIRIIKSSATQANHLTNTFPKMPIHDIWISFFTILANSLLMDLIAMMKHQLLYTSFKIKNMGDP